MPRLRSFPVLCVLFAAASAGAAEWPNWLGPEKNGKSPDTGLLTVWPKEGPKVLWRVPGGEGISSVVVAGGRAFTMVQRGGEELALALDANTGKQLWATALSKGYKDDQGDGPRATPAVDGKFVYFQSAVGPMVALEADSGKVVWQRDLLKDFSAENIQWGLSASPVIEGNLVLVVPGGRGAEVAALDKTTGQTVWKTGDGAAAYASPTVVTVGGKRQAVFFNAAGLLAVAADTGKELWRKAWKTEFDCNIATPLAVGDALFVSSGEKVGCALLRPVEAGEPSLVWESRGPKSVMTNYWANAVLHEGHLFGLSGEFNGVVNLNCVNAETGKLVWSQTRFGPGGLALADGHLFIATRTGELVCVEAAPAGYKEKSRAKLMEPRCYIMPTIADKKLYLRDRKSIVCVDLSGGK